MLAIIETGGKQYRVAPGDVVRVGKIEGEAGWTIDLPLKAVFNESGELVDGPPAVTGTILKNGKSPKVLVFKFKRKKQYKKMIGHRQHFTDVQIGEIVA